MDVQQAVALSAATHTNNPHSHTGERLSTEQSWLHRVARHYQQLPRNRFALEIAAIVLIKMLILYGLWFAFFSQPLAKHMVVPSQQMESHLIATPSISNTSIDISSTPHYNEVNHDSH